MSLMFLVDKNSTFLKIRLTLSDVEVGGIGIYIFCWGSYEQNGGLRSRSHDASM